MPIPNRPVSNHYTTDLILKVLELANQSSFENEGVCTVCEQSVVHQLVECGMISDVTGDACVNVLKKLKRW